MQSLLLLALSFLFSPAYADDHSAKRDLNVSYETYEQNYLNKSQLKVDVPTPSSSSRYYKPENIPAVTEWSSLEALQDGFIKIRDDKFLVWRKEPEKTRRPTWLYPDDGCYARAAMMSRSASKLGLPLPKKVFAFGNLEVETENSTYGSVGWWYHVASIVEVNGQKFVLDPSIDYDKALSLEEWLTRMGTPEKIRVAICESGTIVPASDCTKVSDGEEAGSVLSEQPYLSYEYSRMVKLGRENEI